MEPNNAGQNMWLRTENANKNVKQYAQTGDTDGMQAMYVLYITQIDAMLQQ